MDLPSAEPTSPFIGAKYVGFWKRAAAWLIDSLCLGIIQGLVSALIYLALNKPPGYAAPLSPQIDFEALLISQAVAMLFTLGLWGLLSATPGKLVFNAIIVDARTGGVPTWWQWLIRYFGTALSLLPFGIGLFMAGVHPRKQTLHDLLAHTVVVEIPGAGRVRTLPCASNTTAQTPNILSA